MKARRLAWVMACAALPCVAAAGAPEGSGPSAPWWERPQLTGDWLGARTSIADWGMTLRGSNTQFLQAQTSGEGVRRGALGGKLDGFLDADASRLGAWRGLSLHAHAELNHGDALSSPGGTFLPSNVGLRFPSLDTPSGDLALFLGQKLPGGATLMAGKLNTVDLYSAGREFSGGRGVERFHHLEFAAPASGITPSMTLGALVSAPIGPTKATLFVYDPDSKVGRVGLRRAFEKGTTLNGSVEVGSSLWDRKGRHIVSAAYSTQEGVDFDDIPELILPRALAPGRKDHRWYLSYATEQTLWRDPEEPGRALGVFGQAGVSDGNPNPIGWSALLGVGGTGLLDGRRRDRLGAGVFCLGFSGSLKDALDALRIPIRNEVGAEAFYSAAVTPWLWLTADAMVLRPPQQGADWAVIGGLRAQVVF